jgi:hypothetical protein
MLGAICGTRDVLGRTVPDFRSFLLLEDQYLINDNWHVAGLRGTGSKDIIVENAFVPGYRSQSHIDYAMNAPVLGQERNNGPLYRLPWSVVFNTALVASMLGASRGFVDAWIAQTRDRKLSLGGRAADDALMQRRLAETIWHIDVTVARLRADIAELWQIAEARASVSMKLKAQVRWNMNRGCELVAQGIGDMAQPDCRSKRDQSRCRRIKKAIVNGPIVASAIIKVAIVSQRAARRSPSVALHISRAAAVCFSATRSCNCAWAFLPVTESSPFSAAI